MDNKQTIEELEIVITANVTKALQGIEQVVSTVKNDAGKIKAPIQQISNEVDRTVAKTTTNIDHALQTINGKGSKLNAIKTQIMSTIDSVKALQQVLEELKTGEVSEYTRAFLEPYIAQNVAERDGKSPQEVTYEEIEEELEKIISDEELRGKITSGINDLLKEQNKELKQQEREYSHEKERIENTEQWQRSLHKLWASLKRGLLTILGVRSAWALLRKGMSEALQANEKLQATTRVTSNALGQVFMPVMEKIVAISQKAVIFIGLIIEALTGLNVLAKTTTKSIQDQNKALQGTLSSIDEIENLQQQNDTYLNDIEALGKFQEEVAKMRKWLQDSGIYEWLEKVGKSIREEIIPRLQKLWQETLKPFLTDFLIPTLKDLWDNILYPMLKFILDHPYLFATLFAVFEGGKLALSIGKTVGELGALSGVLSGLVGIGAVAITIGIAFQIGQDIVEMNGDWENVRQSMRKFWDNFYNEMSSANTEAKMDNKSTLDNGLFSLGINASSTNNMVNEYAVYRDGLSKNLKGQINDTYENYKKMKKTLEEYRKENLLTLEDYKTYKKYVDSYYDELIKTRNKLAIGSDDRKMLQDMINEVDDFYGDLYKYEKKLSGATNANVEAIENYNKLVKTANNTFNLGLKEIQTEAEKTADIIGNESNSKSLFSKIKKTAQELKDNLSHAKVSVDVTANTNGLVQSLGQAIQSAFSKKNLASTLKIVFSNKSMAEKIASILAVKEADGYVAYEPTFALQGEYSGAKTNPEITAPRDMIESTMIEAFSKVLPLVAGTNRQGDIVLNIDGKEFARATYEDTQNEIARRNSSTAIKVVR